MIKVNLVPRELLDREVQKQRMAQAAAAAGVLAFVLVILSGVHWYRATKLETELGDLNREYDRLAKVVKQVEELEKTAQAVKTRLDVMNGLLKVRPLYPYFMTDMMATMPPGTWLTSLTTAHKDPNQLTVNLGNAGSNSSDGLTQWLRNIEASGRFEEPKLSGVQVLDKGDSKEYNFSISTVYKNPKL